jgi:hypothetical protein
MSSELLTKRDVMERLRISLQTCDRLRKRGHLPWLNIGSGRKPLVRFRRSDVETFEERVRQSGAGAHPDAAPRLP